MIDDSITDISTNFKRGTTEMLLLALLKKQERYAYELVQELNKASDGLFNVQLPSLYIVLYRLHSKGYVDTRTGMHGIYYRLSPKGREHLDKIVSEYRSISRAINMTLEKSLDQEEKPDETK